MSLSVDPSPVGCRGGLRRFGYGYFSNMSFTVLPAGIMGSTCSV
jgi:hypothetical protein